MGHCEMISRKLTKTLQRDHPAAQRTPQHSSSQGITDAALHDAIGNGFRIRCPWSGKRGYQQTTFRASRLRSTINRGERPSRLLHRSASASSTRQVCICMQLLHKIGKRYVHKTWMRRNRSISSSSPILSRLEPPRESRL